LWNVIATGYASIRLSDLLSRARSLSGAALDYDVHGEKAAYIIHTSGSTERPKGVQVSNRNVLSLLGACDRHFDFRPEDIWTMCHSYGFDSRCRRYSAVFCMAADS